MFRSRKISFGEDITSSVPTLQVVFEFGIIRIHNPSAIEYLVQKATKKIIFSDHQCSPGNTWVHLVETKTHQDLIKIILDIAKAEEYGNFLGTYFFSAAGEPTFLPGEGLLPSQAIQRVHSGLKAVLDGTWKTK